ncbi:17518_t:CDS:2, partial [Acaulospora colombiana]
MKWIFLLDGAEAKISDKVVVGSSAVGFSNNFCRTFCTKRLSSGRQCQFDRKRIPIIDKDTKE